jgi:hypothetical protein
MLTLLNSASALGYKTEGQASRCVTAFHSPPKREAGGRRATSPAEVRRPWGTQRGEFRRSTPVAFPLAPPVEGDREGEASHLRSPPLSNENGGHCGPPRLRDL